MLQKFVYGDNHLLVAVAYESLGVAQFDEGQMNEALESFQNSLKIRQEIVCCHC